MSARLKPDSAVDLISMAVLAQAIAGRMVTFGAYVPDGSDRQFTRGVVFGVVISNTFGVVR